MWTDEKLEEAAVKYADFVREFEGVLTETELRNAFLAGARHILRQTQKEQVTSE